MGDYQKIHSLTEYIKAINNIQPKCEIRSRPPLLLFRGHSDCAYELVPSLGRQPSEYWFDTWQREERYLVESAQQKFPSIFTPADYPAVQLAKLQHYGIKTRMLDLTKNALVALYFACSGSPQKDGEVFAFSAIPLSIYYPLVNAIADTYRLTGNNITSMDLYFYRVQQQSYYASALRPMSKDNPDGEIRHFKDLLANPWFIEAGKLCERQTNQSGYFMIFPNKVRNEKEESHGIVCTDLVSLAKTDDCIVGRLLIAKDSKKTMLEQMERFGITEDFLFADSVDDVCRSIIRECEKRYPRPEDT